MRPLVPVLLAAMIPVASLAQTAPPAAEGATQAATDAAAPAAAPTMRGAPPAGAMKLSEVIAALEARVGTDLAYVEDVDWDDDGYWEVEYRTADGDETEVRLDPATGESRD